MNQATLKGRPILYVFCLVKNHKVLIPNSRYNENEDFDEHGFYDDFEPPTYGRYSGSYAQDEMGYSDDDIDTIFDGDPSAYWNID